MFRELRKPRGDPEVLAAQAREQYFKVFSLSMCVCHPSCLSQDFFLLLSFSLL